MNPLKPYGKRNRRLAKHGIADSYQEYLKSDLWAAIRARALELDGHKCRCCGSRATQVHHTNYTKATLEGTSLKALISLCRPCHKFIEFDADGNKVHPTQVRKRFFMLCATKRKRQGDISHRAPALPSPIAHR